MKNSNISDGRLQEIKKAFVHTLAKLEACSGNEITASKIIEMHPNLGMNLRLLADLRDRINDEAEGLYFIGSNTNGYFLVKTWEDAKSDEDAYRKKIMNMLMKRSKRKKQYQKAINPQGRLHLI